MRIETNGTSPEIFSAIYIFNIFQMGAIGSRSGKSGVSSTGENVPQENFDIPVSHGATIVVAFPIGATIVVSLSIFNIQYSLCLSKVVYLLLRWR